MQLTDLTSPFVASLNKDTPIVFPVAALEQHGQHMPLFTDSLLMGEVIRRVADEYKSRVVFAPLLWLGNSDHHLDFPVRSPPRRARISIRWRGCMKISSCTVSSGS